MNLQDARVGLAHQEWCWLGEGSIKSVLSSSLFGTGTSHSKDYFGKGKKKLESRCKYRKASEVNVYSTEFWVPINILFCHELKIGM